MYNDVAVDYNSYIKSKLLGVSKMKYATTKAANFEFSDGHLVTLPVGTPVYLEDTLPDNKAVVVTVYGDFATSVVPRDSLKAI